MGNALVAFEQAPLEVRAQYAEALAKSNLLPESYRQQPANVLVAIELGASLGLAPMTAINGINVIKGKPTLSASLMAALVRRAGCTLRVNVTGQGQQAEAVATLIRPDDKEFTFEARWNWARAQQAGLTGSRNWQAYPASMMKARAISEVCREGAADFLSGVVYTDEELMTPAGAPLPAGPATVQVAGVEAVEVGDRLDGVEAGGVQGEARSANAPSAASTPSNPAPANATASSSGLEGEALAGAAPHTEEELYEIRAAVFETATALDYSEERITAGVQWVSGGAISEVSELTFEQSEKLIEQMLKNEEMSEAAR